MAAGQGPHVVRGYRYDTLLKKKCAVYHPCQVTNKCQNFDRHNRRCFLCEQRVRPQMNLGGYLPEGEYIPDLQNSVRTIELKLNTPLTHPDQEGQVMNMAEVELDRKEERKALDVIDRFLGMDNVSIEEGVQDIWVNRDEVEKYLGGP
jgi:hypothetical protein